ncbi:MAG TPA: GMC oxidoreductase [Polyangia bacterium]|nr:GMC oxidoreductase [Polyangia bacterium]
MTAAADAAPRALRAGTAARPYFAVVVGTGFGGAVTACRLSQARAAERQADPGAPERPILVLERGRRYHPGDFGRLKLPDYLAAPDAPGSQTSKHLPETARLFWGNDQGLWDVRNLGELRLAQAAGYGGGSLIYANVHLRPPDSVFDQKTWKRTCDGDCACASLQPAAYDRAGLRPFYDRVAAMLELARVPAKDRPPKTRAMQQLATIAGTDAGHFLFPPLAVRFEAPPDGKNRFNREQAACTNCGECTIGCQIGAKNTLDLNYLAVAEDLGAEVRTLSEVQTIRPVAGQPDLLRVTYIDHLTETAEQVLAEHVFLCAGAAGSTAVLKRSEDPEKAEETVPGPAGDGVHTTPLPVPRRLGSRFFANGDNMGVVFGAKPPELGAPLSPTQGPTITATIVHGGPDWFLLQDGGIPPSVIQGLGALRSPLWAARNRFAAPGAGGAGVLAHALAAVHAAHGYWRSDTAPSPTTAVARALRQLIPAALNRIVGDLASAAQLAQAEINAIVDGTLDRVDAELGPILRWLRPRLVPKEKVYGPANEATAARHPLTTDLLAARRPMDYAFAILRFLLLGAPVDDDTMVLLCMGPDHAGTLHWRKQRLRIEWKLDSHNLGLYDTQERLMRDAAAKLGGELRSNPDWTLGRKPVTVHAQGGCGMAASEREGVTTPCARLWTHPRLYVMDGAVFPASVGVNPSSTIAAVAERNVDLFIRRTLPRAQRYWTVFAGGGAEPEPREDFDDSLRRELPAAPANVPRAQPVGLSWHEEMGGQLVPPPSPKPMEPLAAVAAGASHPAGVVDRGHFRALERAGKVAGVPVVLTLDVTAPNLEQLMMQATPRMTVEGTLRIGEDPAASTFPVSGDLLLNMADVPAEQRSSRIWLRPRRLTGMTYRVKGDGVQAVGHKVIEDDPGIDFWNDLSTLHTTVIQGQRQLAGILRVHLPDFMNRQLRQMQVGTDLDDDFAKTWGFVRFARFFFGSITRAYSDWT